MKIAFLSIFLLALSCGGPTTENKPTEIKQTPVEAKKEAPKPIVYKDLILDLKTPNTINDVKALVTNSGLQWDKIAFENDANSIALIKVPEDKTSFWVDKLSQSEEFKTVTPYSKPTLDAMIKKAKMAYFSLRKTECFGDCPVYDVTINEKGMVTYNGKKFVKVSGIQKFQLTEEQLATFKEKLGNANFSSYKKKYDDPNLMDLPSTFISHKDKQVQIRLWRGIPKELSSVQSYVVDMMYDKKFLEE